MPIRYAKMQDPGDVISAASKAFVLTNRNFRFVSTHAGSRGCPLDPSCSERDCIPKRILVICDSISVHNICAVSWYNNSIVIKELLQTYLVRHRQRYSVLREKLFVMCGPSILFYQTS